MSKRILCIFLFLTFALSLPVYAKDPDFPVIPGKEYHVLRWEGFNSSRDKILRIYDIYSGISGLLDYQGSLHYGKITENVQLEVDLPESFTMLKDAREWLAENEPERLRLLPNTIVSEEAFNQWIREGYHANKEYWELSRPGLIYQDIKTDYSIIPAPYVMEELSRSENEKEIQVYINGREVVFGKDKPYLIDDGEVMVPIRSLAEGLGCSVGYRIDALSRGFLALDNGLRIMELSVWQDYLTLGGRKVPLNAGPRLSVNNQIMVSLEAINFLAPEVQFAKDNSVIRITR